MSYGHFTDEDLIRAVYIQDRMVTSDLEQELAKRFIAQGEENTLHSGMLEVLNDFGFETHVTKDIEQVRVALQFAADYDLATVRAVMDAILEYDLDTADALKPMLEIADSIANARENPMEEGIALLHKIFNPTPVTT
jgi:hypothetical protein